MFFQITDNPQVLSSNRLALFDPHHGFTETGGAEISTTKRPEFSSQFEGFEHFLPSLGQDATFTGTVIRLPLRTAFGPAGVPKSAIKDDVNLITPNDIRDIFDTFINGELSSILLFLNSVSCIEILEISEEGTLNLARVSISHSPDNSLPSLQVFSMDTSTIIFVHGDQESSDSWACIHQRAFDFDAAKNLSDRLSMDTDDVVRYLSEEKLRPDMSIAMPLSAVTL